MADTTVSYPYTAVDLSQLPPPKAVVELSFEQTYAEMAAIVQEVLERSGSGITFDPLNDADVGAAVLQVAAYYVMLKTGSVNDGIKAVLLAYSTGSDLDNIGAFYRLKRWLLTPGDPDAGIPDLYESDPDFRRRISLAPEGYSTAGPEGAYIFHALNADPQVADASATSPEDEPGTVVVTVLGREGEGTVSPELVSKVAEYVSARTLRPMTDNVIVQSARIREYTIDADIWTFAGPDSAIVMAEAQRQAEAFAVENHALGRDINVNMVAGALKVAGVQNIKLRSLSEDMILDRTEASNCTAIRLNWAGLGE
jgi:phage-related baseplate assembly protein